jgi:hypothetical protein
MRTFAPSGVAGDREANSDRSGIVWSARMAAVNPDISSDGQVRWLDIDEAHGWLSLRDLATDYWRYMHLDAREQESDSMTAWGCVYAFVDPEDGKPHPRAMDLLQALVDTAAGVNDLNLIGCGPLESLLSHSGHGEAFVDEVERHARQQPAFRTALGGVWLGRDVSPEVRGRLVRLGARDLS